MLHNVYAILDKILPFSWMQYTFMKNALVAVILATPLFGLLGTMVVNNKMAFFSDSIGHSALTGIAVGIIAGIKQPLWSMIIFSVILSIIITFVKKSNISSPDTIIGVFSSASVALGVVILSMGKWGGFNKYTSYLIGDLLGISEVEIAMLFVTLGIAIMLWFAIYNRLLVASINASLAASRGIKTFQIEMIFTLLLAVVVTVSIRWVGILLINSLLILPAASARNIARNTRQYAAYSVIIAFISGILGLICSYYIGSAAGATIVLFSAIFFCISFAAGRMRL